MLTLKEALNHLAGTQRTPVDTFFRDPGIHMLVLKNEGRLLPDKNPEIQRVKLWNIHGTLWLEIENWSIETHLIETKLLKTHTAEFFENTPLDFNIKAEALWEIPVKKPKISVFQKLMLSEITTKIVSVLENMGVPEAPEPRPTFPKTITCPYIFFDLSKVCQTTAKYGEMLGKNTINLLEEEKEGTFAKMQYLLSQNDKHTFTLRRKTCEPQFSTETIETAGAPFKTDVKQHHFLPLNTILAILEEQMTWANWLTRTKPSHIDAIEMSKYIHKSGDFQKIFNYFAKEQNQEWEQITRRVVNHNLLALLLSAATIPELNEKLSKKINRHQISHSIFWIIHKGGLLNQALLKNSWIFGTFKPFANPATLPRRQTAETKTLAPPQIWEPIRRPRQHTPKNTRENTSNNLPANNPKP